MNRRRKMLLEIGNGYEKYMLSFDAHSLLVSTHPWVDGNGRMSRLIMNYLQFEFGLIPSKVKQEDKSEYIQALIDSSEQETVEPFRQFMMENHIQNLQDEIIRLKKLMNMIFWLGMNPKKG